jgi:hypothetical protein
MEKVACGAFSDVGFGAGRQRPDFAGVHLRTPMVICECCEVST